jgi:hypothetical protein
MDGLDRGWPRKYPGAVVQLWRRGPGCSQRTSGDRGWTDCVGDKNLRPCGRPPRQFPDFPQLNSRLSRGDWEGGLLAGARNKAPGASFKFAGASSYVAPWPAMSTSRIGIRTSPFAPYCCGEGAIPVAIVAKRGLGLAAAERGMNADYRFKKLFTASAAFRPSAIAQTTSDCPRRASPAAKIPGIDVA